jgi:hypothetical protein
VCAQVAGAVVALVFLLAGAWALAQWLGCCSHSRRRHGSSASRGSNSKYTRVVGDDSASGLAGDDDEVVEKRQLLPPLCLSLS